MNRYQKLAWYNLIVIISTLTLTSAAIAVEIRMRGFSTVGFWFIAILVLLKFKPFLFKKPQGADTVVCDERDGFIAKRANSFAYTTFWIIFFFSTLATHLILGPRSSVPTITLPLIAVGGSLLIQVLRSIAILIQYGKGGSGYE